MKKGEDYTGISVCFFCHDGNGEYVLTKRSVNCRDEHERWDFGSGGLDVHDTVEDTLRREIREELCTEVLSYEFLGYRDAHREHNGVKTHWLVLDFKVLVHRLSVQIGEPNKFDALEWFPIDALPTPLHSQLPHALSEYRARL